MRSPSLICCLLVAPLTALAGAPAPRETPARGKAELIFKDGERAFAEKRYPDALKAFEEAYLLDPVPVLLYNIGRAHEELGHFEEAGRFFQRYLDRVPDAADRAQVEQRLALLRSAAAAQADAERARADAEKARAEADRARADAELARQDDPPKAVADETTVESDNAMAWTLVGAGGAVLATGVVLLSLASGDAAAAGDLEPTRAGLARFNDLKDESGTLEVVGWVGLGVGAAAAGAGLAMLFMHKAPPTVTIAPGPGGLVVGGHF